MNHTIELKFRRFCWFYFENPKLNIVYCAGVGTYSDHHTLKYWSYGGQADCFLEPNDSHVTVIYLIFGSKYTVNLDSGSIGFGVPSASHNLVTTRRFSVWILNYSDILAIMGSREWFEFQKERSQRELGWKLPPRKLLKFLRKKIPKTPKKLRTLPSSKNY